MSANSKMRKGQTIKIGDVRDQEEALIISK